jgi:hypothetical protein
MAATKETRRAGWTACTKVELMVSKKAGSRVPCWVVKTAVWRVSSWVEWWVTHSAEPKESLWAGWKVCLTAVWMDWKWAAQWELHLAECSAESKVLHSVERWATRWAGPTGALWAGSTAVRRAGS